MEKLYQCLHRWLSPVRVLRGAS